MDIAGKSLSVKHIPGPLGVRGRNSDNRMIYEKLGWKPSRPLMEGLEKTYSWIESQVNDARNKVGKHYPQSVNRKDNANDIASVSA
jgi:hypothetical protein